MSFKRMIEWIVVSFIVGGIISLAVTWISVWFFVRSEYVSSPSRSSRPYTLQAFGIGPEDTRWTLDLEEYSFGVYVGTLINWEGEYHQVLSPPERTGPGTTPKWSRARILPSEDFYGHMVHEVAAGWPFTSWKGEWRQEGGVEPTVYWFCVPVVYKSQLRYPVLLPLLPVFPGGLFNALFWGSIFYTLTTDLKKSIWFFIKHQRRRGGRCASCAYDITGLTTCPECGQPVAPKA